MLIAARSSAAPDAELIMAMVSRSSVLLQTALQRVFRFDKWSLYRG